MTRLQGPRYRQPVETTDPDEVRLPGGNVGGAVLVDGSVRRPTGPWTPAVHELLAHLAAVGLRGVPRVLGTDEQGREMLTYLPGRVLEPDRELPSLAQIISFAGWLREFHEAVQTFRPGTRTWRFGAASLGPDQVICHHDVATYNAAFDGDELAGVFDWDTAGPGLPVDDLAFLAWSSVPLFVPVAPATAARRLRAIAHGYASRPASSSPRGGPVIRPISAADILDGVVRRMTRATDSIEAGQRAGDPGMLNLATIGEPGRTRTSLADLARRLPAIEAELDRGNADEPA